MTKRKLTKYQVAYLVATQKAGLNSHYLNRLLYLLQINSGICLLTAAAKTL